MDMGTGMAKVTPTGKTAEEDLVAAHAELQNPPLDSENPHFKSRFASLAGVRNAVVPVLAKHRFAVVQLVGGAEGKVSVETVLVHASGERILAGNVSITLPPGNAGNPQALGSAITYLRRYSLLAACCVAGEEDDDGNVGAGHSKPGERRPATAPTVHPPQERKPTPQPAAKPPQAPAATGQAGEESIAVYIEKTGKDTKGKNPRYWARDKDRVYYSTFDATVGEALLAAEGTETTIRFVTNEKGYHNVTGIGTAQEPVDPPVDQTDAGAKEDDLPF
jgi:hypothetical protein